MTASFAAYCAGIDKLYEIIGTPEWERAYKREVLALDRIWPKMTVQEQNAVEPYQRRKYEAMIK